MPKRGWMAKQNEPTLRAGDGDVQAAVIGKETNLSSVIGPDGREHNHFLLPTLVPINAFDFKAGVRLTWFPPARHVKQTGQFAHLAIVGRNDADVVWLKVTHGQEVIDHTEHLRRFVPIGPTFAFFIGLFHTFDRNKGHRAVPIGPQKTGRRGTLVRCASVLKTVLIETRTGKFSENGVHSVLCGEHV